MKISQKYLCLLFLSILCVGFSSSAYAGDGLSDDPWMRPQVGIWFGPVTPAGSLWKEVDTYLGGGAYVRFPLFQYGSLGFDSSYQEHPSDGLRRLTVIPMYGNFIFRLPIDTPLIFQLKAGAGSGWVKIEPENKSQYDPLFMAGFEMAFPAGNVVNIGMRIDYIFLYESYRRNAKRDGFLINAGLTLYFNLDIF